MDTIVIVLIIILLIAIGIFIGSQMSGGSTGNVVKSNSYPSQYSGGGCGR